MPRLRLLLAAITATLFSTTAFAQPTPDSAITTALEHAGANSEQIKKALAETPADQLPGMRWLIAHMPESDLQKLDAPFLLENCRLSYNAWRTARWHTSIPEDIFFDAILPYACVNEKRENWRTDFNNRFTPVVGNAQTPSQAAAILNQQIFKLVNVKYSTKRPKADQSPSESIGAGLASCTGLSILLIDACRAVGIPARFAGTALWSDKSGNHSWVEIYDNGWHFTGAAEPSGDKLDEGWFTDRASKAKGDDPMMAIYAVTWRDSSIHFPLVWLPGDRSVHAVNVTDRYTTKSEPLPAGKARIRFRIAGPSGRITSTIRITDTTGATIFEGTSKDERFDSNDHLTAILDLGQKYTLTIPGAPAHPFTAERDEQLIEVQAGDATSK